jgi:hypothetical protein
MLNIFAGVTATLGTALGSRRLRLSNLTNRIATINAEKVEFDADVRRFYIQASQFNR